MELRSDTVEGFHCVFLKGRLDIAGTQSVDLKFTAYTSTTREHVMVDLSEVDFISSIGMRLLATNAKALQAKGAKMILVNPQRVVADSLRMAGMDDLIPITENFTTAVLILRPSPVQP